MDDDLVSSGSSARPEPQLCALCTTPARYKCPRCAIPTCSFPCSRKHKQDTKCSGERDKVHYVPMNSYDWGTMMRDYCYLEDVGRKVSEWGAEIVRGGYMENIGTGKRASSRKYTSRKKSTAGRSKRDALRAHLESLDIDVEFLPPDMARRNLNQSTFDHRSKRPLLTIEFVFYPPTTLASISSSPPTSYRILSHRNDLSATLLTTLQRQVSLTLSKSQKQKENTPDWLPSMVTPHPEAPESFVSPHCYMRAVTEFPHANSVVYYHKLEPSLSIGKLLQRTSFIEFPTIHVFDPEASSFCGTIVDNSGSIVRVSEDNSVNVAKAAKRRKLNEQVGLKAVLSLVGGYGSEDDSNSEEETEKNIQTGLATLEAYSESNDEEFPTGTDTVEVLSSDDDTAEGNRLDPAKLLELLKQAQNAADEDILDWGCESDNDAEEQMLNVGA